MKKNFKTIMQRARTEEELIEEGFQYYQRRKELTMARELPAEEAPLTIKTSWDTLVAETGDMICYTPGEEKKTTLNDYEHWPIQRDLFEATYTRWDDTSLMWTATQTHLLSLGCDAYYKSAGVWAKKITEDHYVLSLESRTSVVIPAGAWLCIGLAGEPWSQTEEDFFSRYIVFKKTEE